MRTTDDTDITDRFIRRVPTKHTNYANGKELYPKLSRRFARFVGETIGVISVIRG